MKNKIASILDYSFPSLDPAIWTSDMKLFAYQKDFILRLIDKMIETYGFKQSNLWLSDIVIIGSLTTSKWLFTSDLDVHIRVDLEAFRASNMPQVTSEEAFNVLDETRKKFDQAKILAPMTQHPIEFYFESMSTNPSNIQDVGVYSIIKDAWLKEPVMLPADLDFEQSKKDVIAQAEALVQGLDVSFGKIQRDIQRIDELEDVVKAWGKDKQQMFYAKVEQKLAEIEAEIMKDLKIKQDLVDARHAGQDATSDVEIKFKWLARFGFFSILSNLKTLLEQTGGQITTHELPLIDKIISESSMKEAFLKDAFDKQVETDICVDLDKTIAKPAKYPEIGEPIEGAKEALQKLKDLGYNVIIYSCRSDSEEDVDLIREYLDKYDLPYDSIFEGEKPFAKFYIDDHAIRFDNWDNVLKQVEKSEKKASLYVTAIDAYYHGGPGASIRQIAKDGYVMAPLETGRANQSPLAGRSYLTKDLGYALIYALGANMVGYKGDDPRYTGGSEGGIVLVAPNDDALIPDEDWLGEQLTSGFCGESNSIYDTLKSQQVLLPVFNNMKKQRQGRIWDASYQSMIGKMTIRILQNYNPDYLKQLAKESPNMSHEGNMKVLQAWIFDKARDNPNLKPDGSNFFQIAQEIPVTKTASLSISANLGDKYWIDPSGKEISLGGLAHNEWILENIITNHSMFQTPENAHLAADDKATEMLQSGWTRVTTETDYDFAMEVADINNLPSYLDNFVAHHYTGGGVEIDDLEGNYQDISDPFPNLRKAIYQAKRLRNAASLFSKRDITAKTKKVKQGSYSCLLALVPHELAQEIVEFGVRNIPDNKLFQDEEGKLGRELESHITVKYGLTTNDAKHIRRSFNNEKPYKATLGKVRHFEPPEAEFDVVTVEIISDDLDKTNKRITKDFECAEGLVSDVYHPHITIAYVKRGAAKDFIGSDVFEGKEIELDTFIFSPHKGNRTYFSISQDKESSFILEKINKFAEFLPSMAENAPTNRWQFAEGGDDVEIALQPDSVSDQITDYEPCTTGKPRTKDVWRQFISIFSNPFSKKENVKIDSEYDPEMDEKEKEEMGLDQTQLEYSKGFYEPEKHDYPHNTTWDSLTQDGEPSKPTSVTYSPQISNEDNLDQNSPGGYPRRFMGKPKGEWFSNEGEVNNTLIQMLKNKAAAVENMTIDITADLSNAYWIDPSGKMYQVRGSDFGNSYTSKDTHYGWIEKNIEMLNNDYGITPLNDQWGQHLDSRDLIAQGWIRIGDSSGDWGVTVQNLDNIPSSVDNCLAQFAHDGAKIMVEGEENGAYETITWPVKSVQQAVNRARRVHANLDITADLPPQQYIPEDLNAATAIRMDDGSIYWSDEPRMLHVELIKKLRLPVELIDTGGRIVDGIYYDSGPLSDTSRYIKQELAKRQIENNQIHSVIKIAITRRYALYVGGRLAIRTLTRAKAIQTCKEKFPTEFASGNYEIKEEDYEIASLKQAGDQSASIPDYLINEWKTDQIHDDVDSEPYVNHQERDYPYGLQDAPQSTNDFPWAKDLTPYVVRLDILENPAYRNDPLGIGEYNVTYYNAMPMSDGIESSNPE